jgi:hypothetical protein
MCMVSMVMDGGMLIPPEKWTKKTYSEFQEIIDRLDKLDKKLDQPDCHDPAKAEWMKNIEDRLKALEDK